MFPPIHTVLLLVLFSVSWEVNAQNSIPDVRSYVTDQTGTLSITNIASLESSLREFDRTTSTQIVVVLVSSTEGMSVEEAAFEMARRKGIGQKGKNNGVLLYVAKADRKVRIEVGYGLEGVLPDILAGRIIRNEIVPRFREGNYYAGITAGADAIMKAARNEYVAEATEDKSTSSVAILIFFMVLLLLFLMSGIRRRRHGFLGGMGLPLPGPWIGGSGRGGWHGGGFGGGGFRGGGGSFGGGGASGSW